MVKPRAIALVARASLALLAGCQLFVGAVETVDGGPDTSTSSSSRATGSSASSSFASSSFSFPGSKRDAGGSSRDAALDGTTPGEACASVPEDCTNGIDDDCDGLVDCEDPECSGPAGSFSCTPLPMDSTWTIVAYSASGRPACPADFEGAATPVLSNISGAAATCGCDCGAPTSPATCVGSWSWNNGQTSSTCQNARQFLPGNSINNGDCVNTSADPLTVPYWWGAANNVATQPGSCGNAQSTGGPPALVSDEGETCGLAKAGGGCAAGSVCAPRVPATFQRCAVASGTVTCPAVANVAAVAPVYSSAMDTRSCGACACGTTDLGCTVTGMQFWSFSNCNGGVFDMTTTCSAIADSTLTVPSMSYKADLKTTGSQGCEVTTPSAPQGSVTPQGPSTVCCEM